jgi:hypothetical protein
MKIKGMSCGQEDPSYDVYVAALSYFRRMFHCCSDSSIRSCKSCQDNLLVAMVALLLLVIS